MSKKQDQVTLNSKVILIICDFRPSALYYEGLKSQAKELNTVTSGQKKTNDISNDQRKQTVIICS